MEARHAEEVVVAGEIRMMNNPQFCSLAYTVGRLDAIKLNSILMEMDAAERLAVFTIVQHGFCKECGYHHSIRNGKIQPCHCTNDE